MSPVILAAAPEDSDRYMKKKYLWPFRWFMSLTGIGGAVTAVDVDTTEDVNKDGRQEPVSEVLNVLIEDEQISPALLATLFLILGIVVFVAVMMKRLTTKPEMIQCAGHLKTPMFTYGSIVFPLDELYKQDFKRKEFFMHQHISNTKTRPTRFVSVSKMWKEQQSKNHGKISRIPEEPEDTESCCNMAFVS